MALWGNNDNIVSSGTVTLNYTSRVVTGAGTSFGANAAVAAGLSPAGFSTVFIVPPTGTAVGDTIIVDRWPVGSGSTITGIGATSVSFASTITKAVAAGQNVLFFGANGAGIANTDFGKIGDVIRFGVRGGAGSGQYYGEGIIVSIANTQSCTIGSTQGLSGDAISAKQHLLSELPKQTAKDSTFVGRQDASFSTLGQAIDVDAISAVGADALSLEIFQFPEGGFAISAGDPEKLSPYECGFEPFDDARNTFDIRFYLVAILFILFDLEATFLFPWAVTLSNLTSLGFWSMFDFIFELVIGFIYAWKIGSLEWE